MNLSPLFSDPAVIAEYRDAVEAQHRKGILTREEVVIARANLKEAETVLRLRAERDPREALRQEAIRKLLCYLHSGVEGFRRQALDRVRELGIDVIDPDTSDGLTQLLVALRLVRF